MKTKTYKKIDFINIFALFSIIILSCTFVCWLAFMNKNDNNIEVDFSTLTYSALGDSITLGRRVDHPYVDLVANILGLNQALNYGIGSSTIATTNNLNGNPMCLRYNKISQNSNIISVFGGINDYAGGHTSIPLGTIANTSNDTFYGALKTLCSGLRTQFPNAYIFIMTPMQISDSLGDSTNSFGYRLIDYVDAIKQVAEIYDIDVLDTYTLNGIENDINANTFDDVHPTQQFTTDTLAPLITNFIKSNYSIR